MRLHRRRLLPAAVKRASTSRCYYELGKLAEAEVAARKAIDEIGANLEESANAHYALATALGKKPDLPAATESIQKAIAVCQKCPPDMVLVSTSRSRSCRSPAWQPDAGGGRL